MKKYLLLQLKRTGKVFPAVCAVALALLVSIGVLLAGAAQRSENDLSNTRLKVAISGDTKNAMMQIGLSALQTFDDTRFAIELVEMPENEAKEKLQAGALSAVVIFPENFIERALYGDVDKIVFITTPGTQNIVSLLKDEITRAIADMALVCEKGSYALYDAIDAYNPRLSAGKYVEELGIEYVQMILARSRVYSLEELGISRGVDVGQYYICSMSVFLLMLFGLCFLTVRLKGDYALDSVLVAKGIGMGKQLVCEFLAHFLSLCALLLVIAAAGAVAVSLSGKAETVHTLLSAAFWVRLLPVVILMAALHGMLYEFAGDPVSAVLLQLLACLGLGYVSGCFYPVYALPLTLQKLAKLLPTGLARQFLECTYSGEGGFLQLAGILGFAGAFFAITVLTRHGKMLGRRR